MMSGQPLKWEVVSGAQARKEGHPTADLETEWLKVHLARPVPKGGEGRVLIDKTYKDAKSYFRDGDTIVFDRSLGIRRNAVVLPCGLPLDQLQRAVPGDGDERWPRDDHVHESRAGGGAFGDSRQARTGGVHAETADHEGNAVDGDRGVTGVSAFGSRPPGSRDRLFPERSDQPLVQPLSRLHRVAAGCRALLQRRASGQQRLEPVGGVAGYRRSAEGGNAERCRVEETRARCRRASGRHHPGRRHFVSGGEAGPVRAVADHGNLHGCSAIPARR